MIGNSKIRHCVKSTGFDICNLCIDSSLYSTMTGQVFNIACKMYFLSALDIRQSLFMIFLYSWYHSKKQEGMLLWRRYRHP